MVQLARPTGKFLQEPDSDTTLVEVYLDGKSVYAAMCMPFGWFGVPSAEWLTKYAKEIVAWVAFEHDNMAHPVIVGFRPLKNKTPGPDYPRMQVWKSEEFTWVTNDKTPKLQLGVIDGLGLVLVPKKLTLGRTDGAQPAVLGEANAARLEDIYDQLAKVADQLTAAAAGLTMLGAPQGASVTAALVPIKLALTQGKQAVKQTKSQEVEVS